MRPLLFRRTAILPLFLFLSVPPVEATVHLMVIQELFPGTPGNPNAQYVMLRMTSEFQRATNGAFLIVEDKDGNFLGRFGTFKLNMLNGGTFLCSYPNCPAILIGTQAAENLFFPQVGTTIDQIVDGQRDGGRLRVALPAAGGRVCFMKFNTFSARNEVFDCVAWGNFTGSNSLPPFSIAGNTCDTNFGTPAQALQPNPGLALARKQFKCTIVQGGKENSLDFVNRFPHPVDNGGTSSTDSDGDGLVNALDCADSDSTALFDPQETQGLNVVISPQGAMPTVLSWTPQDPLTGSSTVYDVVRGNLSDLLFFRVYADPPNPSITCLDRGVSGSTTTDLLPDLLPGEGRYFNVRTRNNCSAGTFGDSDLVPDPRDFLDDRVNGPCL